MFSFHHCLGLMSVINSSMAQPSICFFSTVSGVAKSLNNNVYFVEFISSAGSAVTAVIFI